MIYVLCEQRKVRTKVPPAYWLGGRACRCACAEISSIVVIYESNFEARQELGHNIANTADEHPFSEF